MHAYMHACIHQFIHPATNYQLIHPFIHPSNYRMHPSCPASIRLSNHPFMHATMQPCIHLSIHNQGNRGTVRKTTKRREREERTACAVDCRLFLIVNLPIRLSNENDDDLFRSNLTDITSSLLKVQLDPTSPNRSSHRH